MDLDVITLVKFSKHLEFSKHGISVTRPSSFKYLCITSSGNHDSTTIYSLQDIQDNVTDASVIWKSTQKFCSATFSEDGGYILVVLETLGLQVFQICDEVVTATVEISASQFERLLQENIGAVDVSSLVPVVFSSSHIILSVSGRWLVRLSWSEAHEPQFTRAVEVPHCTSFTTSKETVYTLTTGGNVLAISVDHMRQLGSVNLFSLWPQNQAEAPSSFLHLAVSEDGTTLAVADNEGRVFLTSIASTFRSLDSPAASIANWDCSLSIASGSSTASITSNRSIASRVTATSGEGLHLHNPNKKQKAKSLYFSAWNNYLSSLQKWKQHDRKSHPSTELHLVDCAPESLSTSSLRLSAAGLAVWYSGAAGGVYRLWEVQTGRKLAECSVPAGSVLAHGPGELDTFLSPDRLWLHLCGVSRETLLAKLLHYVEAGSLGQLLQGEEWGGLAVPITTLEEGLRHHHMHVARFALGLHAQALKSALKREGSISEDKELEVVLVHLDELFGTISSYVRGKEKKTAFSEQLVLLTLGHANTLLQLVRDSRPSHLGVTAVRQVMAYVAELRGHLHERAMGGGFEATEQLWGGWPDMVGADVVRDAVSNDDVPLLLAFLVSCRGYTSHTAQEVARREVDAWVRALLAEEQVYKAREILANFCCDPDEELHEICVSSRDIRMRDYLAGHLSSRGLLLDTELTAWCFLRRLEAVFLQHHNAAENVLPLESTTAVGVLSHNHHPGSMAIQTVAQQSEDWRKAVLTVLYFNTVDETLLDVVDGERAWSCLLQHNCVQLLLAWTGHWLHEAAQPHCHLDARLANAFDQWPITQEMINGVVSSRCTKATKDTLLDCFARVGVFTDTEKHNVCLILARLARCKELQNIRAVLGSPYSSLSYEEFEALLAEFCDKHRLYHMAFSCLQKSEVNAEENENSWWLLWRAFLQGVGPGLLDVTSHYLGGAQSPLVAIAGALYSEVLLEETSAARSMPLLNMALESRDPSVVMDVSLYQLLRSCCSFNVSRLFSWQDTHTPSNRADQPPHFSDPKLVSKYGYKDTLSFLHYLKQGRPSFAANMFIAEQFKAHRKLSKNAAVLGSNLVHGLALRHFQDPCITAACISFIEMLGRSSQPARVHVAAANAVLHHLDTTGCDSSRCHQQQLSMLMRGLAQNTSAMCAEFLGVLEIALQEGADNLGVVPALLHWQPAVQFASLHHLRLPTLFLEHCARHDQWLLFVLFAHVYKYPTAQVLELTKLFSSAKLREHLYLALSLGDRRKPGLEKQPSKSRLQQPDSHRTYYNKIGIRKALDIDKPAEQGITGSPSQLSSSSGEDWGGGGEGLGPSEPVFEADNLFLTLLHCHGSADPYQALLAASYNTHNSIYTIFACCYQPSALVACLCTWVSVSIGQCHPLAAWSPSSVTQLAEEAMCMGHVSTLARGWNIFLPDSPLCPFLTFLYNCVVLRMFEDSIISLKLFKAACMNLRNTTVGNVGEGESVEGILVHDSSWIAETAVRLANAALDHCFSSLTHQRLFLQTLCRASFTEHFPVDAPDYNHLWQVSNCLAGSGVRVNWTQLLACPSSELPSCVDQLLATRHFSHALQLAEVAHLPYHRILTAQWLFKLEQLLEGGKQFFAPGDTFFMECEAEFQQFDVDPEQAAGFFKLCSSKVASYKERYYLLRHALTWLRKRVCLEACSVEEEQLELDMWTCWLATEDATLGDTEGCAVLRSPSSHLLDTCVAVKGQLADERDTGRLELLVGLLLKQGSVATACRLEAIFQHSSKELGMLLTSLRLAEGALSPYQLPPELRVVLSETSSGYRHRTLRLSSVSSHKSEVSLQQGGGAGAEAADSNLGLTQEQQDTVSLLEGLAGRMTDAAALGRRVALCYRAAAALHMPFKSILALEDPLNLLRTDYFGERSDMLLVASCLIRAEAPSAEEVADLLCHKIVEAVDRTTLQGEAVPCTVWGCDLSCSFHLLLDLCADLSLLGYKLLSATADVPISTSDTLQKVVDLVVRAHDCFSAACNMEGIVGILRRAQIISRSLLQREEWGLMVRLLTGVGRYTEMSYIFKMLKKNNQFEFLLRKGMDKVPGLKTAAVDFLEKHYSEDTDTSRIVALHFQLHGRVGLQCLREGESRLAALPSQLRNCPSICQALTAAMLDFSQAAQYLLQAEKLTAAMSAAHQAELVALQLSILSGLPAEHTTTSILCLPPDQVSHFITHTLSFPQACIMARAYSHPVDWGAVLFQQCVVHGKADYLPDFSHSMQLTPVLVEDVARRFQKEAAVSKDMVAQMKKFVSCVSNVEVRYRVASQLGFWDIVESLLNSSSLAYLKDTVWRSGFHQ